MNDPLVEQMKAALRTLAKASEHQLAHVRKLGASNDELALEFDDVSSSRMRLLSEGLLSQEQADSIGAVERQLTRMSAIGPSRWTDEAIAHGEDWSSLRQLALLALQTLR